MPDRPICFVISPIGKDGSDIRQRSDRVLKYVIAPVAEELGYQAVRADQISEPGIITTQVINHIVNDPMVVADLTGDNANVFYELAVRHATQKPYVQIIKKGERLPFDVAGVRTIEIDHTDLESVANAKDEIKKQMNFTTAHAGTIESPISVAIDFERLKRSDDPEKRQLGDILQAIGEIKTEMNNYFHRVDFASRLLALRAKSQLARWESLADSPDGRWAHFDEALGAANTWLDQALALKAAKEKDKTEESKLSQQA